MLRKLQTRLFVSYLLLLSVMLAVMGIALFLILNTRGAPPEATYLRLASVALSVDLNTVIADAVFNAPRSTSAWGALAGEFDQVAEDRNIRILIVRGANRRVIYDSAGVYTAQQFFDATIENYDIPTAVQRGLLTRFTSINAIRGTFDNPTDNSEWLFVGLQSIRTGGGQGASAILFADPRPSQSFQEALSDFGAELTMPLLQAGIIGLIIAALLAGWITRGITQPLQNVAKAAAEVAQGRYNQQVPIAGPAEVRAVADSFNSMSEKVRAEQQIQQDFLANVSHDLKTPLTSIQGYSQAIMDGVGDPVPAARIIHEEASRLNRMVLQLTDLARLQAGRLNMRMTPIDIGKLTEAVGQRLAIVAGEKAVKLEVDAPPMPEIAGDGDRLVQVVTNLISNAITYTPRGGCVTVRTQVHDGGVEIVVQDTGIGIASDELPRVFERFYQVDKARGPQRGTGLGLAIAAEIVGAHGGKITAASAGENRGSTFTVWLPLSPTSAVTRRR